MTSVISLIVTMQLWEHCMSEWILLTWDNCLECICVELLGSSDVTLIATIKYEEEITTIWQRKLVGIGDEDHLSTLK